MGNLTSTENRDCGSDQPIGFAVTEWTPPPVPPREAMHGRFCSVEPLEVGAHAEALYEANSLDEKGLNWTYLPYGPFATVSAYLDWAAAAARSEDPMYFAIVDRSSARAVGVAAYLRIAPASGSIEIGGLNYSPLLQRSRAATEAMYLMMERAFMLGYRRYEWKCDALNARSRSSAARLGFTYEGLFRQASVYKNRNRDTAWYSVIDSEWPQLQKAFLRWLAPANFDSHGRQRASLQALRRD